jgi:ABC-type transport system involved in multi-copper enzyme maturation permease subunit
VPIDIASYRRWEGRAHPTPLAAFAIASTMIRRRMKIKLVRFIVGAFLFLPSLIASVIFYFGRMSGDMLSSLGGGNVKNVNLLAVANQTFDTAIGFWAGLLAALVGAPLIAEDRRAHALPLYFSRPIGHIEYVAGKAMCAASFLACMLLLPRIILYAVDIGLSDAGGSAVAQLPTLLNSCVVGVLGVVIFTAISLGVSSVTERPTYGSLFLIGVIVITTALAFHLRVLDPTWLVVSPDACVLRIGMDLVEVPPLPGLAVPIVKELPVGEAWIGFGAWCALGFGVLFLRVRRVEVVT